MLTHPSPVGVHIERIETEQSVEHSHEYLVELLQTLAMQGYRFTTVTPVTHERFLARGLVGKDLRDIFGWNLPFKVSALSPLLHNLMTEAGLLQACGDYMKSKVRVSSLAEDLFLHSAFPTTASNAVFFGPDTYRFSRFIRHTLQSEKNAVLTAPINAGQPVRVLDIGCGSGAGGVVAARSLPGSVVEVTMNDINPVAIDYARVNTTAAAVDSQFLFGDIFNTRKEMFDLIISNPPYMKDNAKRAYRDGGGHLGLALSVRIVQHAIKHLAPGGRLLLYTGVAMVGQSDPFMAEVVPLLTEARCHWSYEEIDPDIFGEELEQPSYVNASRIAAVGLVVTRPPYR